MQFRFVHPALSLSNQGVGANHASALPFWFAVTDGGTSVRSVAELALGHTMAGWLAGLAASGSPTSRPHATTTATAAGAAVGVDWTAWEPVKQPVMEILLPGENGRPEGSFVSSNARREMCDFWEGVPDSYTPIM